MNMHTAGAIGPGAKAASGLVDDNAGRTVGYRSMARRHGERRANPRDEGGFPGGMRAVAGDQLHGEIRGARRDGHRQHEAVPRRAAAAGKRVGEGKVPSAGPGANDTAALGPADEQCQLRGARSLRSHDAKALRLGLVQRAEVVLQREVITIHQRDGGGLGVGIEDEDARAVVKFGEVHLRNIQRVRSPTDEAEAGDVRAVGRFGRCLEKSAWVRR